MRSQAKGPLTEAAYVDAREKCWRIGRTEGIDALAMREHLDAFIALANAPASLIVAPPGGGDPIFGARGPGGGGGSSPAALAGYPAITVPVAEVSGLPIGLVFYGRAWTEAKLIALASDFEARTHVRREPDFRPTINGAPRE
jgi:amidase